MERRHYMDEFESFLEEKADQYKLYPSDRVWENINKHLHPNRRWPYITAGLLLIGLSFVAERFILHSGGTSQSSSLNSPAQSENNNDLAPSERQNVISSHTPSINRISRSSNANTSQGNRQQARVISLNEWLLAERRQDLTQKPERGLISGFTSFPALPVPKQNPGREEELIIVNNPIAKLESSAPSVQSPILFSVTPSTKALNASLEQQKATVNAEPAADAETARPWLDNIVFHQQQKKLNKWAWQFYVSPTVSYRKLTGSIEAKNTPVPLSGIPYIANAEYGKDINDAVNQHPSLGAELGTSWIYNATPTLRLKVGIQLNYTRYMIKAYRAAPERAAYAPSDPNGYYADSIRLVSVYRNFNGYMPVELTNEYFQLAAPLGAEFRILGNRKMEWIIAGTAQPTYNLNNQAYLISTNFKNYAEEPTLIRRWNMAASLETFLSINTGKFKWQIGPQFRYQLLSSYKNKYPIKEYLLDYGFKIGVSKTIR